jgi:hypothetical protein
MKRITSLILSAAMLMAALMTSGFAVPVSANTSCGDHHLAETSLLGRLQDQMEPKAEGPWLPDPCNLFGVEGSYLESQMYEGVRYNYYCYMVKCTLDELCQERVDYAFALMDLGYHVTDFDLDDFVCATRYSKAGTYAEMAATVYDDGGYYNPNGVVTWVVLLAVPENMSFELGLGTPGVIQGHLQCPGCEGSGKCQGCHGSGRDNYGAGYVTCVVCDGARYCNICDGVGY